MWLTPLLIPPPVDLSLLNGTKRRRGRKRRGVASGRDRGGEGEGKKKLSLDSREGHLLCSLVTF